ncbi:hypothetical protein [Streptomyces sp. NRRL F-5123]|uniref:hypothetical protein n=1 Tax=Streptomyces sp. NRRL F-5123 TaxID=1463856 RepID=UPI0004E2140E|nr:hypothetical protein [Streptomyces sp. NRRL F-5123]
MILNARRTIARSLIAAASAALLALGFSGEAAAAYQYVWVYNSGGGTCVSNYSEVTTGTGGSYVSRAGAWNNGCSNNYYAAAGDLAVDTMPLWYDFGTSTWIVCFESGWFINLSAGQQVSITGSGLKYRCGVDKWYANNTGAYAYVNGSMHGGWYPSGNEWLAADGLAASKPPAEPKISAATAIRTGQVRIGSPTGPKATKAQLQPAPGRNAAGIPQALQVAVTVK